MAQRFACSAARNWPESCSSAAATGLSQASGSISASAPSLPGRQAASLKGALTPHGFAPLLAASFARLLTLWRTSEPAALAQAWLIRAHPVGAQLTVHTSPHESVSGRFEGIEPDGALRLRTEQGIEIVRAGDVLLD